MNRQAVAAIQVLCYGFITLISLIALVNVFNTMSTNLMLRRREFAMLRSVGMSDRDFNKMMRFECSLYGVRTMLWGAAPCRDSILSDLCGYECRGRRDEICVPMGQYGSQYTRCVPGSFHYHGICRRKNQKGEYHRRSAG